MRLVTDYESMVQDVRRFAATRAVLAGQLQRVLTALALTADAQALTQQRLDALGVEADDDGDTPGHLQRSAAHYRDMMRSLSHSGISTNRAADR